MKLWLATHFLFAALFLSSSALTPEECQPLIEPLSLANTSMLLGKRNFLVGYVDHDVYRAILNVTDSSWLNIMQSPDDTNEFDIFQHNKINGVCLRSKSKSTFKGDTAKTSVVNVTSSFHFLPTCEGCVVFSINSTARHLGKLLKSLKISSQVDTDEVNARAVYLLGRETTLKDADLERFKQQASCLGFSGEPDFLHDAEKGLCQEGEGVEMM